MPMALLRTVAVADADITEASALTARAVQGCDQVLWATTKTNCARGLGRPTPSRPRSWRVTLATAEASRFATGDRPQPRPGLSRQGCDQRLIAPPL